MIDCPGISNGVLARKKHNSAFPIVVIIGDESNELCYESYEPMKATHGQTNSLGHRDTRVCDS